MSSLTILSLEKQSVQTGFDPGVELATKVQPLLRDIVIVPPSSPRRQDNDDNHRCEQRHRHFEKTIK